MQIPEHVRNKAEVHGATQWLAELPTIVADLEQRWEFTAGKPYADGTEAYVCEATRHDGSGAVLKMLVPRDGELADREISMFRLVDGDGCVRLLEADNARHAMLLERLGPSLRDLDLPIRCRHEILCDTVQRFWRPAPDEHPFMTGAEKATSLIACAERLGRSSIDPARRMPWRWRSGRPSRGAMPTRPPISCSFMGLCTIGTRCRRPTARSS